MINSDSPVFARIVLGIVAAMVLVIPLGITLKTANDLALIEKTARMTNGTITGKMCKNHGKSFFSYFANGKSYNTAGLSCGISCENASVGNSVVVIYSDEKPILSRCDSLKPSRDVIPGNLMAIAILSVGAAALIFRFTRLEQLPPP